VPASAVEDSVPAPTLGSSAANAPEPTKAPVPAAATPPAQPAVESLGSADWDAAPSVQPPEQQPPALSAAAPAFAQPPPQQQQQQQPPPAFKDSASMHTSINPAFEEEPSLGTADWDADDGVAPVQLSTSQQPAHAQGGAGQEPPADVSCENGSCWICFLAVKECCIAASTKRQWSRRSLFCQ
jgi:hypothetical protein